MATQLYQGHSYYYKGVLGEDGDLVFMDREFRVVYGEFCVAKLVCLFRLVCLTRK